MEEKHYDNQTLMKNEHFNPKRKVGGIRNHHASVKELRPTVPKTTGLEALTAIIQPQQVAEDKKVAERTVEYKLSNLEKSQKSSGSNTAANFPGKRSK